MFWGVDQVFPSDTGRLVKTRPEFSRTVEESSRREDRGLNAVPNHHGVQSLLDLVYFKRTQIGVDVVEYRAIKRHPFAVRVEAVIRACFRHRSLSSLCFPHCLSLREEANTRSTCRLSALNTPMRMH